MSSFLNLTEKAMQVSVYQRNIIANNVANYNTPGFKPTDVNFEDFFNSTALPLKTTDPKHISISNLDNATYTDASGQKTADGNNVDINKEMTDMIKNNYYYNNAISAFNNEIDLTKTALGK